MNLMLQQQLILSHAYDKMKSVQGKMIQHNLVQETDTCEFTQYLSLQINMTNVHVCRAAGCLTLCDPIQQVISVALR